MSVVAVFIFRAFNQQDSNLNQNLNQKPRTQTVETETKSPEKAKKKTKKTKPADPMAAITNSLDKSIAKELDKAQSVLDKGQIADAFEKV